MSGKNNPKRTIGIIFNEKGKIVKSPKEKRNNEVLNDIWHLLTTKNLSNETRYILVSKLVRDWTERTTTGKYRGAPYWSEEAYNKYQEILKQYEKYGDIDKECAKYFRHEHVLPVKACVEGFSTVKDLTKDKVRKTLYNDLNAAIILKTEDEKLNEDYKESMPDSFLETENIFDRYSEVGIKLKYVAWDMDNQEINDVKDMDLKLNVLENHITHAMQDTAKQIEGNLNSFIEDSMAKFEAIKKSKKD